MNILDRIIDTKRLEVQQLKLEGLPLVERPSLTPTIHQSLGGTDLSVIAEIKRASPSKGDISLNVDPVAQAKRYAASGATVISVLTDATYFKGSMQDLAAVAQAVDVPVLCKDFMIDRIQIDVAKAHGARLILLIVAALDDETLHDLYDYAYANGLEVLVEVHDATELERAERLQAKIIGINNRNLKKFEVNLETSLQLLKTKSENVRYISESGIKTIEEAKMLHAAGADGILIGETLMRADDPAEFIQTVSGAHHDTH
ncbi:indole-3-glycerol phosphate synthase TrpC [Exiguobacterium antarcticum]|uniref:Indole-3-glycerol phosphate synthase n=1 Tax=Exiguobacterium antarcticum TaxID=132920 RepID=A0ABT6R3I7_9BACL|nr:indole-3-glycerol phosphate synthase TrpC [Exiguobacterium antarcticum]AFS70039.1 Indole-3-glycerol phosphate synthase [Exiguobacterium antarcticum B7]MDI3235332.1 indole-3-glycerol phosphate synthase TrpC [Exiguobacterium antarcticum]